MQYNVSSYSLPIGSAINIFGLTDNGEAVSRIISFITRPDGWKFGRGKKPKVATIAYALSIVGLLVRLQARETGAFLTEDGSILVTGYYDGWHTEVLCSSSEQFVVIIERDKKEEFAQEYNKFPDAALAVIEQVRKWGAATNSSGYFTLTTMTSNSAGFKAGLFQDRPVMEAYLSSVYSVLAPGAAQFANIYDQNIEQLPESFQYSGSSDVQNFRTAPA